MRTLPIGGAWQFEPKWDGLRCLAFKSHGQAELRGKSGKSLSRYFPEMLRALESGAADDFVLDGELSVSVDGARSLAALQDRIHPAAAHVRRLAARTPASLILFDCLLADAGSLIEAPFCRRRAALEAACVGLPRKYLRPTPFTRDRKVALDWLDQDRLGVDGVMAKRLDLPYAAGRPDMLKVKRLRTVDCVAGGFRYDRAGVQVGSLLLGLYDDQGRLDYVGIVSSLSDADRPVLTSRCEAARGGPGFTGAAPGGPSRWRNEQIPPWEALHPTLVVEVGYDRAVDGRFNHGARVLRCRHDKAPKGCTLDHIREKAFGW